MKNKKDLGINNVAKKLVNRVKRENIKTIKGLVKVGKYYPKQKDFD